MIALRVHRITSWKALEEIVLATLLVLGGAAVVSIETGGRRNHPSQDHPAPAEEVDPSLPAAGEDDATDTLLDLGLDILPRTDWAARKPTGAARPLGEPELETIHHEAGEPMRESDLERTVRRLQGIQTHHQEERGWLDMAYHFVVDRAGRIWEGRSIHRVGAHAGSTESNRGNIGILVLGNFDRQRLTPPQTTSLFELLERILARWNLSRHRVRTHNEVRLESGQGSTECPGRHLTTWVHRYRRGQI